MAKSRFNFFQKLGVSATAASLFLTQATSRVAAQPAGCDPGSNNLNLGDCLYLDPQAGTTVGGTYSSPAALLNTVLNNVFPILGVFFLLILIYTGYEYIVQGKQGVENARKILTTAIIGLIVMISAYWVVQVVEVITGVDILL